MIVGSIDSAKLEGRAQEFLQELKGYHVAISIERLVAFSSFRFLMCLCLYM